MKGNILIRIVYYLLVALIIYFSFLPILGVVLYGIFPLDSFESMIRIGIRALPYLKNSLFVSFLVTIISITIGTISAICLWRFEFKGRNIMRSLILLPMINPPFVSSIAFIMLFGRRGLITHKLLGLSISPFGWHGIVFMQCLSLGTLAYLIISSSIKKIDPSIENAARNLGASEKRLLFDITLPVMIPEITTATVMVFLSSIADFGTPLIIGGSFQTLASDLYIQITGLYDMKSASISGVLLLIPCITFFLIQKRYVYKNQYFSRNTGSENIVYNNHSIKGKRVVVSITFAYIFLVVFKYVFIIIGAFTNQWGYDYSFTLKHVIKVFSKDFTPFINSIQLSFIVAIIASFIGVLLSYFIKRKKFKLNKFVDFLGTIPAAVPGILFGIGYLVTFKYPILGIGRFWLKGLKPLILLGTGVIIYLICIFRYLSVGLRAGYALIEHMNPNIEDASRNLGASEGRTFFSIVLPVMAPAFSAAFLKNFSTTMTTLGAIIFLLLPSNKVAVQQIFQVMTSSATGVAAAMALMLSATTAIMLFIFTIIYNRLLRIKR